MNPNAQPVNTGTMVCIDCDRAFITAIGWRSLDKIGVRLPGSSWKRGYCCPQCLRRRKEKPEWNSLCAIGGTYVSRVGNRIVVTREEKDRVFFMRDGLERSSAKTSFFANYKLEVAA